MPRLTLASSLFAAAAVTALALPAQARPIYIEYDDIKGDVTANATATETIVGGQRFVQIHTPTGSGGIVFRPSDANAGRPMETMSLNYGRVGAAIPPTGATVDFADDVWVDGRIITAAVGARWRNAGAGAVELSFSKSSSIGGTLEVVVKRAGQPVGRNVCVGDTFGCWVLTALCPGLECSIMCPALCGVPSTARPDPSGGVAIDLPFGNLVTFSIPGHAPLTGDEVSVILRPAAGDGPMALAGTRLFVGGLSGFELSNVRAELGCPADFNGSGTITVQDIFDFLAAYFANTAGADFNSAGGVSVQDIFDYLAAYFAGCP